MKIGRIQNQLINSNLVRNVKKVIKPAVLATTLTLGGLAAGSCSTKHEEPRYYCRGCDYVVYPGTDLNVAHETLYKQFDLAKSESEKDDIMASAVLLEMADSEGDEIISRTDISDLKGWELKTTEEGMRLSYHDEKNNPGININLPAKDLSKCNIDGYYFMYDGVFAISRWFNGNINIVGSKPNYEIYIDSNDKNKTHIKVGGNDIKYLKIANSKIHSITVMNRNKDLNIDLINVKGHRLSPVEINKIQAKSNININTINSKYEYQYIVNYDETKDE